MTPFLAAFVPALTTLMFLVNRPHSPWVVLLLAGLLAVLLHLDRVGTKPLRPDTRRGLDAILFSLFAIQLANIIMLSAFHYGPFDTALSVLLVGISTGTSVIVAHELIHRRNHAFRGMGRVLLWTAFYDHFYVEHLRGPHARVGTEEDPSTARLGEDFWRYALRNIPGEFVSALRIDARRVMVGVAFEAALVCSIGLVFGSGAVSLFLAQVAVVWVLIAAVNYLQHWGLERIGRRFTTSVAWDCDSSLSNHLLLGLSRHADHHLHPTRTYTALRATPDSPKLPHGYLRMLILILFFNRRTKEMLTETICAYAAAIPKRGRSGVQ